MSRLTRLQARLAREKTRRDNLNTEHANTLKVLAAGKGSANFQKHGIKPFEDALNSSEARIEQLETEIDALNGTTSRSTLAKFVPVST